MKHVVMFSGGAGSWATAVRVREQQGTKDLVLLFADTLMEDEDLYRFVSQAAENVGGQFVRLQEGRTPWEVFEDVRFLGNTRIDPCSRVLKREVLRKHLEQNFSPTETIVYLGIDWTEEHRFERAKPYWRPWKIEAPLCQKPLLSKAVILRQLQAAGIEPPRLYAMGFPHNNCGGFCIKAGQAHFKLLLEQMPDRYRFHEEKEAALGQHLGKKVTVLRDRRGGKTTPLSLREFRERVESQCPIDEQEWGGCGCFSG